MKVQTIAGEFNETRYKQLKQAYERAVSNNIVEFEFEGSEYLASFVKYLIEFLEYTFKPVKNANTTGSSSISTG